MALLLTGLHYVLPTWVTCIDPWRNDVRTPIICTIERSRRHKTIGHAATALIIWTTGKRSGRSLRFIAVWFTVLHVVSVTWLSLWFSSLGVLEEYGSVQHTSMHCQCIDVCWTTDSFTPNEWSSRGIIGRRQVPICFSSKLIHGQSHSEVGVNYFWLDVCLMIS